MDQIKLFEDHIDEYDAWYDEYKFVFLSEVAAIQDAMPAGDDLYGLEIGVGTGRFAEALGFKEGVDPSAAMRERAAKRGINVRDAYAEELPYKDMSFHVILMNFCISYFDDLHMAFKEALRVLKHEGVLMVGFIDRNSIIGKAYQSRKAESAFYKHASFYAADKVADELKRVGFKNLTFSQTLFEGLDGISEVEEARPGYGEGSFVLIKATK